MPFEGYIHNFARRRANQWRPGGARRPSEILGPPVRGPLAPGRGSAEHRRVNKSVCQGCRAEPTPADFSKAVLPARRRNSASNIKLAGQNRSPGAAPACTTARTARGRIACRARICGYVCGGWHATEESPRAKGSEWVPTRRAEIVMCCGDHREMRRWSW